MKYPLSKLNSVKNVYFNRLPLEFIASNQPLSFIKKSLRTYFWNTFTHKFNVESLLTTSCVHVQNMLSYLYLTTFIIPFNCNLHRQGMAANQFISRPSVQTHFSYIQLYQEKSSCTLPPVLGIHMHTQERELQYHTQ